MSASTPTSLQERRHQGFNDFQAFVAPNAKFGTPYGLYGEYRVWYDHPEWVIEGDTEPEPERSYSPGFDVAEFGGRPVGRVVFETWRVGLMDNADSHAFFLRLESADKTMAINMVSAPGMEVGDERQFLRWGEGLRLVQASPAAWAAELAENFYVSRQRADVQEVELTEQPQSYFEHVRELTGSLLVERLPF